MVPARIGIMRLASEQTVLRMLYGVGPGRPWARFTYPETASGIANAANNDPFFPDEETGAEATATILVADAWLASQLNPDHLSRYGCGLFQIQAPTTPKIDVHLLTRPQTAALVAVDLMRESVRRSTARPMKEWLGWYRDLGRVAVVPSDAMKISREALVRSREIFALATELYERHCRDLSSRADRPTGRPADRERASSRRPPARPEQNRPPARREQENRT